MNPENNNTNANSGVVDLNKFKYVIGFSDFIGGILGNVFSYKRFKSFFSIMDYVPSIDWDYVFFGRASSSIDDALDTLSKVRAISTFQYRNKKDPNWESAPIHHLYRFHKESENYVNFLIYDNAFLNAFNIPLDSPENFFINLSVWNTLPSKYSVLKGFIANGGEPPEFKEDQIFNINQNVFRNAVDKTLDKLNGYRHIRQVEKHGEDQSILEYQFDKKGICERYEYLDLEKEELGKTLEFVNSLDDDEASFDALIEHLYGDDVTRDSIGIKEIYSAIDNVKRICEHNYRIKNDRFYTLFVDNLYHNLKELSEGYTGHKQWWDRIINYFGVIADATQEIPLKQRMSFNGNGTVYIYQPKPSDELDQLIIDKCEGLPEETSNKKAYIPHFQHLTQLKENILEEYWKEKPNVS